MSDAYSDTVRTYPEDQEQTAGSVAEDHAERSARANGGVRAEPPRPDCTRDAQRPAGSQTSSNPTSVAAPVARVGAIAAKHGGTVAGKRAVDRAANARMVGEGIVRTHPKQIRDAADTAMFVKDRAGAIKRAADRAAAEGRRAGGREQLKGVVIELRDNATYNAKNRISGKKLVPRIDGRNEAYDASRFIKGKFAGGVQQKSSAAGVEKTIARMERVKPGSAPKGVLRVPRDQVSEAQRRAAGRLKEVKGMEFTLAHADAKLDQGLVDIARNGTSAGSAARAAAKGAAVGAAISAGIGAAGDIAALTRNEISALDFAENRTIDIVEGATNALVGTAATTVGGAAATAALGTTAGAAVGGTLGSIGTAAVGTIGGMGSLGAGAAGILGGVTVGAAAPFVVGGAASVAVVWLTSKGFRRIRRHVQGRQEQRRSVGAPQIWPQVGSAGAENYWEVIVEAIAAQPQGRADSAGAEASVRDLLGGLSEAEP